MNITNCVHVYTFKNICMHAVVNTPAPAVSGKASYVRGSHSHGGSVWWTWHTAGVGWLGTHTEETMLRLRYTARWKFSRYAIFVDFVDWPQTFKNKCMNIWIGVMSHTCALFICKIYYIWHCQSTKILCFIKVWKYKVITTSKPKLACAKYNGIRLTFPYSFPDTRKFCLILYTFPNLYLDIP